MGCRAVGRGRGAARRDCGMAGWRCGAAGRGCGAVGRDHGTVAGVVRRQGCGAAGRSCAAVRYDRGAAGRGSGATGQDCAAAGRSRGAAGVIAPRVLWGGDMGLWGAGRDGVAAAGRSRGAAGIKERLCQAQPATKNQTINNLTNTATNKAMINQQLATCNQQLDKHGQKPIANNQQQTCTTTNNAHPPPHAFHANARSSGRQGGPACLSTGTHPLEASSQHRKAYSSIRLGSMEGMRQHPQTTTNNDTSDSHATSNQRPTRLKRPATGLKNTQAVFVVGCCV